MATIPTPHDIIGFLESYDLDLKKTIATEVVTANATTNQIAVGGGVGYADGDMIAFAGSDIPAPLIAGTIYYANVVDTTHIHVSLSYADALNDIYIDLTDAGTGTITMTKQDYYFISAEWIRKRRDGFVIPWIERILGMKISTTEQKVEYYSGNGRNILVLNHRPVVSIDQIMYVLGGNNLSILNLGNIEVVKDEGILKAKRNYEEAYYLPVFAKGDYNLKVTATYGMTTVPDDIAECVMYLCCEQALGFVGARTGGGNSGGQVSKSFGDRGMYTEIRNDLARQAHAIINKYTTNVVGN